MTTNYKFGEIVLVPFPFSNQSTTKKRPAVVISSADYHEQLPDLLIMAITSQTRTIQTFGETIVNDWQSAGLLKPSIIKPVITTIEPSLVIRKLGQLTSEDQKMLKHTIASIIGRSFQ